MIRIAGVAALVLGIGCQGSTDPGSAESDLLGVGRNGPDGRTSGGDVRCTGTLTGSFDEVTVPVGATCTLSGSTVKGNVKALENARLFMSDTHVGGNVEGDKAAIVQVSGGRVDGNIQIKDGTSHGELGASVTGGTIVTGGDIQIEKMHTARVLVADARVLKGNLQVVENSTSGSLEILRNHVAGNLQVFKNRGGGNKVVSGNTVSQDLQCKENSSPFTGGPNAAGEAEEQCFRS